MTENEVFTPDEFRNRLRKGPASTSPMLTPVAGFVRESELGDVYLQISMMADGPWVDLPYSMIDRVEHIRNPRGKNESHPIVILHFKEFDNPEVQAIIALMEHKAEVKSKQKQISGSQKAAQCSCSDTHAQSTQTGMPGSDIRDGHFWCTVWIGGGDSCINCLNECLAAGTSIKACRCC